jgi:hypothetical protein
MSEVVTFARMGREIARRWGKRHESLEASIPGANNEEKSVALLAAIADLVGELIGSVDDARITLSRSDGQTEDVSGGMLQAFNNLSGKIKLEYYDLRLAKVGSKAAGGICANFNTVNELTPDRLMEIKGVGTTTCRRVMEWRDAQVPGPAVSPDQDKG